MRDHDPYRSMRGLEKHCNQWLGFASGAGCEGSQVGSLKVSIISIKTSIDVASIFAQMKFKETDALGGILNRCRFKSDVSVAIEPLRQSAK
ncbi:hypothetical protein [Breoghania sp.]|uniref:hypothetical protein n=1 Tax=Breoghania sp. TaxID=2065378 RepID=UPI002AABD450|nr:hypothetical protein [Breoghania sp.]